MVKRVIIVSSVALLLAAVLFWLFFISPLPWICSRKAPGLTEEGITSISLGMKPLEVVGLVGRPLRIREGFNVAWKKTPHGYSREVVDQSLPRRTWVYANPSSCFPGGLEAYVVFVGDEVSGVYLEYFDLGIYRLDNERGRQLWNHKLIRRLPHSPATARTQPPTLRERLGE